MELAIEERIEIFNLYLANTARRTAAIFNQRHPERARPLSHTTVLAIKRKFDETGSMRNKPRSGRPSLVSNENVFNQVRKSVDVNPRTHLRAIIANVNLSRNTVFHILHNHNYHPYKAQKHQKTLGGDDQARLMFCNAYNEMMIREPLMNLNVLWSDESLFRLNGSFNRNNNRYNSNSKFH